MKNNAKVLLKALLLSTSQINTYRYCKDRKRRGKVIAGAIGFGVLFLLLIAYCVATAVGYGQIGAGSAIPVTCALIISVMAFFLTLFKTNGYLFGFKEYDMLMSLPFDAKTVAGCKFLYMYAQSLPWYLGISLSMMIGYGICEKPHFLVWPVWILLSFALPLIPMLVAAFLGYLITRITAGFRNRNLLQTVLTMAVVLAFFALRFQMEDMFRNEKVEEVMSSLSEICEQAGKLYPPAGWFSGAVTQLRIADMLLLAGISIALFEAVFLLVGRSYRKINSALHSHAAARSFRMTKQKSRGICRSIAFKEFRRLMGSTTYLVNGAMGEVLSVGFGLAVLILGFDRIIVTVTNGAPVSGQLLYPSIPLIVYFFLGMVATTTCSPSLEGKNFWIVKSLPIDSRDLYRGKMLFNLYLTLPFMAFTTLCICISAHVPVLTTLLFLLEGAVLCGFSSAWGCVCGIRFMRLDWENEVEVVKQGAAVAIYLFPNMFVTMGLVVLMVVLGTRMDVNLLSALFTLIVLGLGAAAYKRAMTLAVKRG